ncbi:MAG: hypothetical protein GX489_01800 [Firmicutes bacterium]|nr:hypothetical protein [Bacillota bacterium]
MELPRMRAQLPRTLGDTGSIQQVARVIVFIVLSALGAMVRIGSPLGVLTLADAPAYFVALTFGWLEGALVGGIGTMLAGLAAGFPLGVLVHVYSAVQAALWATCLRLAYERGGPLLAFLTTTFLAGVVGAVLSWPLGGLPLVTGSLARLIATAVVNVLAGTVLFLLLTRSEVVYVRRRN